MRTKVTKQFQIIIFSALLLVSFFSYGVTSENSEGKSATPVSATSAPNIQQSANTSQKQNNSAAMISKVIGAANIAFGGYLIAKGSASHPVGYGLIAQGVMHVGMGGLAFMQAKQHSGSAYGSGLTGVDTSAWVDPFGNPNVPTQDFDHLTTNDSSKDKDLTSKIDLKKFNDVKSQLFGSGIGGIKMDPKSGKITDTKTGKTYDAAQMASAESMAQAGFSPADIAASMSAAAGIEKAALKKLGVTEGIGAATAENGYLDGGGSGSLSGKTSDSGDSSGGGQRGLASSGAGVKIPSNQIAGLTKNFNGERIGVSAENIFNMMTRRYKTKEKQNSFFDPSEMVKMPQ